MMSWNYHLLSWAEVLSIFENYYFHSAVLLLHRELGNPKALCAAGHLNIILSWT